MAAITVFAFHLETIVPGLISPIGHGHDAVIIFFVLSGYIISYATATREFTSESYLSNRLARLYSVAIPALLLTVVCDHIGIEADSATYSSYPHDYPAIRLFSAAFFSSEFWFLSIQPLSNIPYWSLCYEFWYYLMFAAYLFLAGARRTLTITIIGLIIGPKILLLLPVWLLGVALYRWSSKRNPGPVLGGLLFTASFAGFFLLNKYNAYAYSERIMRDIFSAHTLQLLEFSKSFPIDYVIGLLVAVNILGFKALSVIFSFGKRLSWFVSYVASFTLSIYLYHYPLLIFFVALLKPKPEDSFTQLLVVGLTFSVIFLLGIFTEHKKKSVRSLLLRLYQMLIKLGTGKRYLKYP